VQKKILYMKSTEKYGVCLYLSPSNVRQVLENADAFGIMSSPRTGVKREIKEGWLWALDNDAYNNAGVLDFAAWLAALLAHFPWQRTCLFVVVPDVPFNAAATLAQFEAFAELLRAQGWPVALVTQDGMWAEGDVIMSEGEQEITDYLGDLALDGADLYGDAEYWDAWQSWYQRVPWESFDVLFIGGTDKHKLGPEAGALADEAARRGVPVHVGRVNSPSRLRDWWRAFSWDGTTICIDPENARGIATAVREVRALKDAGTLF